MSDTQILKVTLGICAALPFYFFLQMAIGWSIRAVKAKASPLLTGIIAIASGNIIVFLLLYFGVMEKSGLSAIEVLSGVLYIGLGLVGFSYFYFATCLVCESSLHMHLILMIFRAPGITREEIQSSYSKQIMLSERIARLVELKQIEVANGQVRLLRQPLLWGAMLCDFWKILLGFPTKFTGLGGQK